MTLDGNGWLTSHCGHFDPGEAVQYPLIRRLGGPQSKSVCFGEEKYPIPYRNLNLGHPASSIDKQRLQRVMVVTKLYRKGTFVEQDYVLGCDRESSLLKHWYLSN